MRRERSRGGDPPRVDGRGCPTAPPRAQRSRVDDADRTASRAARRAGRVQPRYRGDDLRVTSWRLGLVVARVKKAPAGLESIAALAVSDATASMLQTPAALNDCFRASVPAV